MRERTEEEYKTLVRKQVFKLYNEAKEKVKRGAMTAEEFEEYKKKLFASLRT